MKASDVKCPRCGGAIVDVPGDYDFTPSPHVEIRARSVYCGSGHQVLVGAVRRGKSVRYQVYEVPPPH